MLRHTEMVFQIWRSPNTVKRQEFKECDLENSSQKQQLCDLKIY